MVKTSSGVVLVGGLGREATHPSQGALGCGDGTALAAPRNGVPAVHTLHPSLPPASVQIESGGVTHEHTRKWLYLQELQVGAEGPWQGRGGVLPLSGGGCVRSHTRK